MDSFLHTLDPAEFALRCAASEGDAAYLLYVVPSDQSAALIEELRLELLAMDVAVSAVGPRTTDALLRAAETDGANALLVDATGFDAEDWRLLDRRRSSLQRRAVTVLVTTAEHFADSMRHAPNLMSWLGAEVFAFPGLETQQGKQARDREQRLLALRAWSGLTDDAILEAAAAKTLPRDPEYAEWLVLLGRGDLLDA